MHTSLPFIKMHGIGNDFVIIDGRHAKITLSADHIRRISDRHKGIGCDQLIVTRLSTQADCYMKIYNADGSESGACGNATRCVAYLLMSEAGSRYATIETKRGVLPVWSAGDMEIGVNMGVARLGWEDIPLSKPLDTLHLGIGFGVYADPVGVSMGNPHAVFFVSDLDRLDINTIGATLGKHELFPEGANIGFAQIVSKEEIRLRVYERGVGETLACGSGACAALVAAHRRGYTESQAIVHLPGGSLDISWKPDGAVHMVGSVAMVYTGVMDPSLSDVSKI